MGEISERGSDGAVATLTPVHDNAGFHVPAGDLEIRQNPIRVRGTTPARTPIALADLMRAAGAGSEMLAATAGWLSGERRTSPATRDGYVRDLSWWIAYATARRLDMADVDPIEADLYAAALREAGLAEPTRARRISAAASWYAYLGRARGVPNPFDGMERPRVPGASSTRGMSEDELQRMLAYARQRETPRTYAVLALLVATAARDGSIVGARLDGLGHDRGHRVIDLPVKGAAGKTKRFVLPPLACEAIDAWLAARGGEDGPLFTTKTGQPLDQPYLYRLVKRVATAAGVTPVSPHGIRHSVITLLLSKGHPLHVVQDLAGHADPRTTRRYDRAAESLDRSPAYELGQIIAAGVERHAGRWT